MYSGEQVITLLAAARNSQNVARRDETKGWTEHKSRRTINIEKKLESKTPRKRKFSPQHNKNDGCCVCGKKGHFKDECRYLRCRFCKMLGHVIAECPTLPKKLMVNSNG